MNPNHTVMVEGLRLPRLVVDQMMARACSPWGRVIDWCDALRDHNPKLWPIKHNPESEPIEKAAGR